MRPPPPSHCFGDSGAPERAEPAGPRIRRRRGEAGPAAAASSPTPGMHDGTLSQREGGGPQGGERAREKESERAGDPATTRPGFAPQRWRLPAAPAPAPVRRWPRHKVRAMPMLCSLSPSAPARFPGPRTGPGPGVRPRRPPPWARLRLPQGGVAVRRVAAPRDCVVCGKPGTPPPGAAVSNRQDRVGGLSQRGAVSRGPGAASRGNPPPGLFASETRTLSGRRAQSRIPRGRPGLAPAVRVCHCLGSLPKLQPCLVQSPGCLSGAEHARVHGRIRPNLKR